ncbi:MAG: DUF3040 domain-containing protein [bacterium]|nr:DUF3040 domain-containing protein [bacterium]
MPLSEYEQRVLAQMEQQLRDADPELAQSLQAPARGRFDVRRLSLGILVALIGIGALVAGVAANQVWLGILGFVGMLAGALLATTLTSGSSSAAAPADDPDSPSPARKGGSSSFMERQQERWEKRQENS